jgi:hypothetical protein
LVGLVYLHVHSCERYNSGVTVKLPGISCIGNKVQVHGLDIVEGKINNDDVSVLRDTGCSTVENSYLDVLVGLVYLHVHSCELTETLLLCQSAHQQFLASVLLSKVLTLYYNLPLTVLLQRIVLQSQGSQHRVDINKVSLAYVYKLSMNILLMAIIVV